MTSTNMIAPTYEVRRPPLVDTFDLPTRDELLAVEVGDAVKLILVGSDGAGERCWVEVTERDDSQEWVGRLVNQPVWIEARYGDPITFHPLDSIDWTRRPAEMEAPR